MMMKEDGARIMIPQRSLFVAGHERERREEMCEGVREAGGQRR
jgi:hypothetical protein